MTPATGPAASLVPGAPVLEVWEPELVALLEPEALRVEVRVVAVPLPGRAVLKPEETADVTGGTIPPAPEVGVALLVMTAGEDPEAEPDEADWEPVEAAPVEVAEPEGMPETPPPQSELAASRAFWRSSLEQPFSRQGVAEERIFSWFSDLQAHVRSVRSQPVLLRAGSRQVIAHWGTLEMSGS